MAMRQYRILTREEALERFNRLKKELGVPMQPEKPVRPILTQAVIEWPKTNTAKDPSRADSSRG